MNQQLYRIVFNQARGCLMAVAETATGQGKGQGKAGERRSAGAGHNGIALPGLQTLTLALASVLFLTSVAVTPTVQAQIVADHSAPTNQRPTILTTGNSIPLVNIQTPSAAGVSRNTYSQFDVTAAGTVLNNSRTNVQTQLGGWVQANPWLATGGARVILNEVNSTNPSQLRGAIEVAGQRAEVVIANPAGIQVDGAGFINTSQATLTTGTPIFSNGNLDGYRVQTGTIRITGAGLDASSTDSTAILARAVEVNAGIWANQLTVTTGANDISADAATTTAVAGTGTAPSFALDVAAIGGMYAGKITLVGTEAGLGVRNAGVIQANAGNLTLNADGWLSNTGSLLANQNLTAQTSGAVTNSGTVYASGNTGLTAEGNIHNTGLIAALGDTQLNSGGAISSASGAVLAAGLAADNTVGSSGKLAVTSTGNTTLAGQSVAGADVHITASSINVAGGQLSGQNLSLTANTGDVTATGATLVASQTLAARTTQTLRTDGAVLSADQLNLAAHDLSNVGGRLLQTGTDDLALSLAGNLDNTGGTIATNGNLALAAATLDNTRGSITSDQSASLSATTRLDNTDGSIAASQHLDLSGGNLVNTRGTVQATQGNAILVATDFSNSAGSVAAGGNLQTQVATLSNTGNLYAGGSQTLAASGAVTNSGVIAALGDTTLTAQSLSSTATSLLAAGLKSDGSLASTGNLNATTSQGLAAHGQNIAAGSASLRGTTLDLAGSQTSATALALSATAGALNATGAKLLAAQTLGASSTQTLVTNGATVSAQQIQLGAQALSNVGGNIVQTGSGDFHLNLAGSFNNSGGVLQTAGRATIAAQSLDNANGSISGTDVSITTAGVLHNTGTGLIAATQDLTLATTGAGANLVNQGNLQAGRNLGATSSAGLANTGTIYAGGNARLTAAGALSNSSVIAAQGNTSVAAASLASTSTSLLAAGLKADGTLGSSGDLAVTTTGTLAAQGQNVAGGNAVLNGASVDLSGSLTSAANLSLTASSGSINASHATLMASQTLVATTTQTLTTDTAVISANQLNLAAHEISNVGGTILQTGTGGFNLNLAGTLNNANGTIASNGATSLVVQSLNNQNGLVQSAASADLSVDVAAGINNTDGTVKSAGRTTLVAGSLNNTRGSITSADQLSSTVAADVNNTQGQIASNGALTLQAASVNNDTGTIASAQSSLTLTSQGVLNNHLGHLQAAGNTVLDSTLLTNTGGTIVGKSLQIQTHGNALNNQSGTIVATGSANAGDGNATLHTGALNNDAGLVQAGDSLVIDTSGQTLTNTHSGSTGGIFAQDNASLTTGDIANSGGFLAARGNLTVSGAGITNSTGGTIASGGTLAIHGNALDNSAGGQMQAVGNLSVAVGAGTINNAAGFIHASGNTQLSAASINNSNTSGTSKGIEGWNVAVQANNINNQNGSIRADNILSVTGSGLLNNTQGLLTSARSLSIQDSQASNTSNNLGKTLTLTNTGGTLKASQSVLIDSAGLSFDGTVASQGSVTAKLLGDYTHTGSAQWQADGALSLAFSGNFTNTASLQVLGNLRVDAANISNTAQGQIAGSDVTLVANNTITNQGSVVGIDNLTLQAGLAIRNVGPGALLGAANSTGTLALLAPVIENRDDTTATDATPTTLIYGMGNVILAGIGVDANGNPTRAQSILNQSAQIESGASMLLAANQITNTRRELTVDNTFVAYGTTTSGQAVWTEANPNVPGGRYIEPPHGGLYNSDYLYNTYTQDTQRNSIISISPEAHIIAGNNLSFNTSLLQNYWSKVTAINDIALGNATVDQDSWRGATPLMERTTSSGTYEYRTYRGWLWNNLWGPEIQDTVLSGYESSIALSGTLSGNGATLHNGASSTAAASGSAGNTAALGSINTALTSVASIVAGTSLGNQSTSLQTHALALGQSSASGTSVPTRISTPQSDPRLVATGIRGGNLGAGTVTAASVLSNITLPGSSSGGLFHIAPNPGSRYLVETNPAFTNQQTWLSSDWYLSQLGFNPDAVQKRLGDGFYEQRLVREQVLALTGRTQLSGYQNEQAQYQALLAAGAATAKAFDIRPGIALTDAQMASLTTDVVMLEERTVQGQRVLVPVVYLAHVQEGDLLPSGALIAAGNIELYDSQGLVNRGTIRATNNMVLDGVNLDSRGGNLRSGGLMQITTRGDVDLSNAQLKAGSLSLDTGGSLLLASTTTTGGYQISGAAAGSASHTLLERIASIDVQGDAVIRTAGDFTQNGARLAVGGNLAALVGGDWNLGTVQTGDTKQVTRVGRVSGNASSTETYNTTSSVSVGGNTLAQVGGNLTAVGAQLDLAGGGTLAVKGNIDLSAAVDRLQVDSKAASSGSGRSHSDTLHQDAQTLQGTRISAGDSLALVSGGDISLKASSISLTQGNLALQAAGDILIGTQNQHIELNRTHTGSHSTGVAKKSSAEAHSSTSDSAIASSLSAGSITALAARDLTITGSSLTAQADTTLRAARDVTIQSAQNTSLTSDFQQTNRSGLSGSLMNGINFGKTASDQALSVQQTVNTGSSVSGANVSISARRDATVSASTVIADTDLAISAGRNANILAASDSQTSTQSAHSSSSNHSLSPGLSGRLTIYGKSQAEQTGNADGTTAVTSALSANAGSLSITAGTDAQYKGSGQGNITTQGADLLAKDSIALTGNAVDLQAISSTSRSATQSQSRSVTLGSTPTGLIGSAITAITDNITLAQNTDNSRLQGAATLKAGYDAYKLGSGISKAVSAGTNPVASKEAFGASVNLTASKSSQSTADSDSSARGTNLQADKISIISREGDISATGAKLQAQQIALDAARNLNLTAAANHSTVQTRNSSSSTGLGVTVAFGGEQNGISFQVSASRASGHSNGSETTYDNTLVTATDSLSIRSGGDTNLQGAQLAGKTVTADIGGNLNIQTLQDQSAFTSEQKNAGFSISLCIPPICAGVPVTGSVNYGKSSIDHNYQSATGQSGIAVGDSTGAGGFDIKVAGNTDLQGGAITSTASAEHNSLQTASITSSDLANQQTTSAQSTQVGLAYGGLTSIGATLAANAASNLLGSLGSGAGMPANEDTHTSTLSVISPATVTLTGTGNAQTDANSAQTVATLTSRDASTANGALTNTLTLQQAAQLQAQQKVAQQNQQAANLVGAVMANEIGGLARDFGWGDGSTQKLVLHGVSGAIQAAIAGGNVGAGLAAGVANEYLTDLVVGYLREQGIDPRSKDGESYLKAASTLIGAAAGALVGGSAGAAVGGNVALVNTTNNYLKHADATRLANLKLQKSLGKCDTSCDRDIADLQALDDIRNQKLSACEGVNTIACDNTRQEVRNAAAEYIRKNNTIGSNDIANTYASEREETLALAGGTMNGKTAGFVQGAVNTVVDGAAALGNLLATVAGSAFGITQSQQDLREGAGAAYDFVKDPNNWPQLLGVMGSADREKLAQAYERGDGKTVGQIMSAQLVNLPMSGGGGMLGTISKLDKAAEIASDAAKVAKGVEGAVEAAIRADGLPVKQVAAGSKGNWDSAINGKLEANTAYQLDTGHTYVTDTSGRVTSVEGKLDASTLDRNGYQQCTTGKCGNVGDEGGHLIAASLGGAGDKINIVPQAMTLNRGDWKAMENFLRDEMSAGKSVNVKIDVGYPIGGGVRPNSFTVDAVIDGKLWTKEFKQ